MRKLFTEHPASVGETYFEHMFSAFGFGARLISAGLACIVHGTFPVLFHPNGEFYRQEIAS